jgi:hypothetical protein
MIRSTFAFALLGGALVLATGASAQPFSYDGPAGGPYRAAPAPVPVDAYGRPLPRNARGQVCVPWCPADRNPCDPPEYKQADGRCDYRD